MHGHCHFSQCAKAIISEIPINDFYTTLNYSQLPELYTVTAAAFSYNKYTFNANCFRKFDIFITTVHLFPSCI